MKIPTTRGRFLWKAGLYLIFCLVAFNGALSAGPRLDSLLMELDGTILRQGQYQSAKVEYIDKLKRQLDNPYLGEENRYFLYHQLTREYESFRCDTALVYALRCLNLAEKSGQSAWILESKLKLAAVFSKASLFNKALDTLRRTPPADRLTPSRQVHARTMVVLRTGHGRRTPAACQTRPQIRMVSPARIGAYGQSGIGTKSGLSINACTIRLE